MSSPMKWHRNPAPANRRTEGASARWLWALSAALCLVVLATPSHSQGAATVGVRPASNLDAQTAAWLQASILETLARGETRPQIEPAPRQPLADTAARESAGVYLTLYGEDQALPLVVRRISRGRLANLQAQADASGQAPSAMALSAVTPGTVAPLATPPSTTADIVVYPLAGQRVSATRPGTLAPLQFRQQRSPPHWWASPLTQPRLPLYHPGDRLNHSLPLRRELWPWMPNARHTPLPRGHWWLLDPGPAWPP